MAKQPKPVSQSHAAGSRLPRTVIIVVLLMLL
jgi:hypothetical protein